MREVWLKPNLRALQLGLLLPMALIAAGGVLLWWGWSDRGLWPRVVGLPLVLIGGWGLLGLVRDLRRPRMAYADGVVELYLRSGAPIRLPVEIVEGFLIGQAPSLLPGKYRERYETTTFILRLAESATEWSHGTVKPALGRWCDGYITIRGTWCEPLSVDLARRLNQRLHDVQQEFQQT